MMDNHPYFSTRALLWLSIGSALIYFLLTVIIVRFFHDATVLSLFQHGFTPVTQLGVGALSGIVAAFLIGNLIFRTPVSEILKDYRIISLLGEMRLTPFDRLQISLFAGAGEELLFRGALQPLLGIWVTSLIFVAIHGYFKFTTIRHVMFGALMFALSAGLGFLFEWAGLLAAMAAHAVYDVVMLQLGIKYGFGKGKRNPPGPSNM